MVGVVGGGGGGWGGGGGGGVGGWWGWGGGGGGFTWARTRVHKGQHRLIFLLGGAVQGDDEDVLAVEGSE